MNTHQSLLKSTRTRREYKTTANTVQQTKVKHGPYIMRNIPSMTPPKGTNPHKSNGKPGFRRGYVVLGGMTRKTSKNVQ